MKYPKLIESLEGKELRHWSKMKPGDRYFWKIKLRRLMKFGDNPKRISTETYFITPIKK